MAYEYGKLIGRIIEVCGTRAEFAKQMGLSERTISLKLNGKIDWKQNSQWLRLLSVSGTPLFVSCQPDQAKGQIEADLQEAFCRAAVQQDTLIPLDWMENPWPERWSVNGKEMRFCWD